jgi:CheY-like chemotaxis protein
MLGVQARMLLSMGYSKVRIAASAEAAMKLMATDRVAVDIVICDLNMPDIDGIEFLKLLSASEFRCSVVLLSGQGVRLMNTVQKVLGSRGPQILGALEKPAGRGSLRALLECWSPLDAEPAALPELTFSVDELHAAVEAQAWELHYQPKVNVQTGALAGMEALVRWRHPLHGLVYPKSFIGLAEECGVIDAITQWVLREALDEYGRWQRVGLRAGMAINVSAQNLHAPKFAYALGAMVRGSSAAPADLTLELTESRLLAPSTAALENLARLRMQGFNVIAIAKKDVNYI